MNTTFPQSTQNTLRDKVKSVMRWLLGLTVLTYLLLQMDLQRVSQHLFELKLEYIVYVFLITLGSRFLLAYKWYLLLIVNEPSFTLSQVLRMHFVSNAVGLMLPVLGADLVAGYYSYRESGRAVSSLSSVFVDRALGMYSLILTAVVGVCISLDMFIGHQSLIVLTGGALLLAVVGTGALTYLFWCKGKVIAQMIPSRWSGLVVDVREAFDGYFKRRPRAIMWATGLSFINQGFRIVAMYILALAIGFEVSMSALMAIIPLGLLIALIPISVNGLGLQEGAYIFLLGLLGVSAESAFIYSMLARVLVMVAVLPGVFWLMTGRN